MCTRDYCIAVKVCLPTDLTEVGRGLLVTAGHMPQQASLLHEARLTELTAEGSLAGLGVAVLVQADLGAEVLPQRWSWKGFSPVCVLKCMLRLAFWVKAGLQSSHTRPLVPVLGHDVHLQEILAPYLVSAVLAHRQLLSVVLESLAQLQFHSGQESLGPGGTGMGPRGSLCLGSVALKVLLLHGLLGAGGTLVGHLPRVGHHVHPELHPPSEALLAEEACDHLFPAVPPVSGFMLQRVLLMKVTLSTFRILKGFLLGVFPVVSM